MNGVKNSCQITVTLSGVSSDCQSSVNGLPISLHCCLNYWTLCTHWSRLILMMASCQRRICGKVWFKYYMICFNNKLNFKYNSRGKIWESVLLSEELFCRGLIIVAFCGQGTLYERYFFYFYWFSYWYSKELLNLSNLGSSAQFDSLNYMPLIVIYLLWAGLFGFLL